MHSSLLSGIYFVKSWPIYVFAFGWKWVSKNSGAIAILEGQDYDRGVGQTYG